MKPTARLLRWLADLFDPPAPAKVQIAGLLYGYDDGFTDGCRITVADGERIEAGTLVGIDAAGNATVMMGGRK